MAKINRYDSPAESNYFNTFVPLPLDQITALGMKRQEDLERKQDAASKYIDEASLVDYIAGSKDEEWVKQNYLPSLQKYAEEAMSVDLSNPVEWAKYSTKLRSMGTSDRIRRIEESKARWNQAQEMKQRLIAAGKYNQLLDEDPATGWDSTSGIYNYMPEAYTDKSELFEQYYKHMKPRSKGIVTLNGGIRALREGIDIGDVRGISDRAAQELAANPLGQQQVKLFRKMYPDVASELNDVDILKMQMEDYGRQYISSNDQILPEFAQGAGRDPNAGLFDIIPVSTGGKAWEVDPAGVGKELSIIYGATPLAVAGTYANAGAGQATMGIPRDIPEGLAAAMGQNRTNNINSAYKKIVDKYPVFAKGPDGKDLTPEETINNYKTAVEEWQNTSSTVYAFGNEQVNNEWNRQVARTLTHRQAIIPGTDTPVDIKKLAKHYGYSYEEFVKALGDSDDMRVQVNAPSINARGVGWSSIQVIPKNGKPSAREDALISSSKDESVYFEDYYKLQNSLKSDQSTPVILSEANDGSGRKIAALPIKRMGYNAMGRPSMEVSIAEFIVDENLNPIGDPIDVNKTLNDYYNEAISAMIKGKHFDKDTKGLKSEY